MNRWLIPPPNINLNKSTPKHHEKLRPTSCQSIPRQTPRPPQLSLTSLPSPYNTHPEFLVDVPARSLTLSCHVSQLKPSSRLIDPSPSNPIGGPMPSPIPIPIPCPGVDPSPIGPLPSGSHAEGHRNGGVVVS